MSKKSDNLENITKNNIKVNIKYENKIDLEKKGKPEVKISELKKEMIEIKKELDTIPKETFEVFSEEQKQKNVEQTIKKWLNLQKTIKEEITLEDVIFKQQENDKENLKELFRQYYNIKINTRRNLEDIKKLKLEKDRNLPSFLVEKEVENKLRDACEPIKNLFFIIRNNYDYLTRLISLINQEDYSKNSEKINSLVELFNNQFYENILIPNPEQQELLLLIYKLLEEEIIPMAGVCPKEFLNNKSFSGKLLSSYSQRQEIIGYISMLINPTILSIENSPEECFELSINEIKKYLKRLENQTNYNIINYNSINNHSIGCTQSLEMRNDRNNFNDFNNPNYLKNYLCDKIPKTKIKFKNNFELEAEIEKDDEEIKFTSKDDDDLYDSEYNLINFKNKRRTVTQQRTLFFGNKDNDYNNEYKYDLTKNRLFEKISKENNPELKQFYIKHLEQINNNPKKFTNEGIITILENEDKKQQIISKFRANFLIIRKLIEGLLQKFIDRIITLPYQIRCIW